MENNKKEVGKQELCKWISRALKAALTPNNITAGFRSTGIWPLDRIATIQRMEAAVGFKSNIDDTVGCEHGRRVTGPTSDNGAATGLAGFKLSAPLQIGVGFDS